MVGYFNAQNLKPVPFACLFDYIDSKGHIVRNDSSCVRCLFRSLFPAHGLALANSSNNHPNSKHQNHFPMHCSWNRYAQPKGRICNLIAIFLYWLEANQRSIASFSNKGHLIAVSRGKGSAVLVFMNLCSVPRRPCHPLPLTSPCQLPWTSLLK